MANSLAQLRSQLKKKAEDALSSRNPLEFNPPLGKTNVRFLPPINDDDMFYYTHGYHYLPGSGETPGRYIYTHKNYTVDGKKLKDPIDVAVSQWYETGKRTKDDAILNIAGTVKRKHHFVFNVILLAEPDPDKKYRVLVDRSNDGKLARIICTVMGLPFFRSIQDNWVDKTSLEIDEDKEYFDLIDIDGGHDFKIVKTQVGEKSWDVSYADSFAIKKPRALTDDERELLEKRVDLKTYASYEEDYFAVKAALDSFVDGLGDDAATASDAAGADEEEVPAPAPKAKKKQEVKKPASDDELDEILDELDA